MADPTKAMKEIVCQRVGANIYGRAAVFIARAEAGDDAGARAELMALLEFFPVDSNEPDILVGNCPVCAGKGAFPETGLACDACYGGGEWSGSPDPEDPDNFWVDDKTGERVNAQTGERTEGRAHG